MSSAVAEPVHRSHLAKLLAGATAVAVVVVVTFALLVAFEQPAAVRLWSWAVALIEANWRRALGPGGQMVIFTLLLMIIELFFLSWEKTTIFAMFVRRSGSTWIDAVSTVAYFSQLRWIVEYILSFGLAFLGAKLANSAADKLGWIRLELPSNGILEILLAFSVYYLVQSFVAYWHHRVSHWRWFWQLHKLHHATTDLNILTGFRVNPAEAIYNLPLAISPLIFLKIPDAGLFATFFLINQVLASLQHSQLPWSFGWVGDWIIASPQNHQVHHSVDPEHKDRNFSICPLWDRVFGTWYGGDKRPSAYGIPDNMHVERPATQWLIDCWYFYRDISLAFAGGVRSARARLKGRTAPGDDISVAASIPAAGEQRLGAQGS